MSGYSYKIADMGNNDTSWYSKSDPAILESLGDFIRETRLKQGKTQQFVAESGGVSRSTLVQFENGKGGTLLSFIQILRSLEQFYLLEGFEIKTQLSPLQLAELAQKKRQRAQKTKSISQKRESSW